MTNRQNLNPTMETVYESTLQPRAPPISAKHHVLRGFLLHRTGREIGEGNRPEIAVARNRVDWRRRNSGGLSLAHSLSFARSLTKDPDRHQRTLQPARRGRPGVAVRRPPHDSRGCTVVFPSLESLRRGRGRT